MAADNRFARDIGRDDGSQVLAIELYRGTLNNADTVFIGNIVVLRTVISA